MAIYGLRTRIAAGSAAVVAVTGLVATLAGVHFLGAGVVRQAQIKVSNDLNTARHIFEDSLEGVKTMVSYTAVRRYLVDNLREGKIEPLRKEIESVRKRGGLDMLALADSAGRVIVRAHKGTGRGDSVMSIETVRRALKDGVPLSAVEIMPAAVLAREGGGLAGRARISLVPTPRARPDQRTVADSGMMMLGAAPIRGYDGKVIGVLYGGNLVNRDYRIVDEVKRIVYRNLTYKGRDVGTTTIFLRDTRISTNVPQAGGSRAIGTRVSSEVYEEVIGKGGQWLGRAFVVNDWYISAYEPIRDVKGEIVGILYVGILEREYTDVKRRAVLAFLLIMAAGIAVAMVAAFLIAGGITGPLRRLVSASRRMAEGDLEQSIEPGPADETGELGRAFNAMALAIRERDEQLRKRTQQMLMKSDRLATIGRLAAGVAHEINNPLGGVLVYSSLLSEDPAIQGTARDNLGRIMNEATRCKRIVKGLLDFAHQSKPERRSLNVNEALAVTLGMVEKQALFQDIEVVRRLGEGLPAIEADLSQLQQVFLNLVINAAEAMNGRGTLTVATRLSRDGRYVEAEISDTGCGISPENMKKLFEPFFTTKDVGRGTGLGLAISYGIIEGHNGIIDVRSEAGRGTAFTVALPVARHPATVGSNLPATSEGFK